MISVMFSDACEEHLDDGWRATCQELTMLEAGSPLASKHFERSVRDLYRLVDRLFSSSFTRSSAGLSEAADSESTGNVPSQNSLPFVAGRWQSGTFPCIPLDRDDERPLREALPSRPTCHASQHILELVVSIPPLSVTDVRPGNWGPASTVKEPKAKPRPQTKRAKKKMPIDNSTDSMDDDNW